MKKIILLALMSFTIGSIFATDNEKFIKIMTESIESLYTAETADDNLAVVRKLERIAQAEPNKWEPRYYAAFGYIRVSDRTEDPTKKDELLNLALKLVDDGIKVAPNEAELQVLKGYVYAMQLMVDPMTRGQQYSGLAMGSYSKALEIDNNNPRAWYMFGTMQLGTARFMGTGNEVGCKSLNVSLEKFEGFSSDNPLAPTWGLGSLKKSLQECEK